MPPRVAVVVRHSDHTRPVEDDARPRVISPDQRTVADNAVLVPLEAVAAVARPKYTAGADEEDMVCIGRKDTVGRAVRAGLENAPAATTIRRAEQSAGEVEGIARRSGREPDVADSLTGRDADVLPGLAAIGRAHERGVASRGICNARRRGAYAVQGRIGCAPTDLGKARPTVVRDLRLAGKSNGHRARRRGVVNPVRIGAGIGEAPA